MLGFLSLSLSMSALGWTRASLLAGALAAFLAYGRARATKGQEAEEGGQPPGSSVPLGV